MAKLKFCPFCGGQACMERWEMVPFEKKHILEENDGFFYGVACISCDASSGSKLCEEEAITAWNRRAGENEQT